MSMPNPYPIDLRERAVRAYEAGDGTYAAVADRFSVNLWTLWRWVQRRRATGTVAACDKRGGWSSPVVLEVMHAIVRDTPDAPTGELTRVYTRRVPLAHRVHRSSVLRALRRTGYVFKKPVRGPRNRTGPTSAPSAPRSASGPRGSIPRGSCLWMNRARIWRWAGRMRGSSGGPSWSTRGRCIGGTT